MNTGYEMEGDKRERQASKAGDFIDKTIDADEKERLAKRRKMQAEKNERFLARMPAREKELKRQEKTGPHYRTGRDGEMVEVKDYKKKIDYARPIIEKRLGRKATMGELLMLTNLPVFIEGSLKDFVQRDWLKTFVLAKEQEEEETAKKLFQDAVDAGLPDPVRAPTPEP